MKCVICGNDDFSILHRGVRDNDKINVMKCNKCGMVCLDTKEFNSNERYQKDMMRQNAYNGSTDKKDDFISWNDWINNCAKDDQRRYEQLLELCKNKTVLDFGCGCGGFMRRIQHAAKDVGGVELSEEARKRLKEENLQTWEFIDDIDEQYDVIVSFHVIEHINEPDDWIESIKKHLKPGGLFVCETPNADDALIEMYKCIPFMDFTFWSEHVFLYNSDALGNIMKRHNIEAISNTQIMRYNLANHLYWLAAGKPGGDKKWIDFNEENLAKGYADKLIDKKMADTLWFVGKLLVPTVC